MDEEISRLVRNVVRCGPDAIKATISRLQDQLATFYDGKDSPENGELPHCRLTDHRTKIVGSYLCHPNTYIDGDFLLCKSCDRKVASSVRLCTCDWQEPGADAGGARLTVYMIGDRDFLRTRCRSCHRIVGGIEHYPK